MRPSRSSSVVRGSECALALACIAGAFLVFMLYAFPAHGAESPDPFFYKRGDVGDVRCYSKSYLRRHVGKKSARELYRANPDARSLCGVLRCRGEHCHFDALVFVDERPDPPRRVPSVQAKTRKKVRR